MDKYINNFDPKNPIDLLKLFALILGSYGLMIAIFHIVVLLPQ